MNSSIVGTWRLVKGTASYEDGSPAPPPYGGVKAMGRVTFDADGRMMAVLCDGRAEIPAGETREYNSYCGSYTFDGTRLVTRVDATSDGARLAGDQVREVSREGRYMIFRPPVRHVAGRRIQRELWWERIAEV